MDQVLKQKLEMEAKEEEKKLKEMEQRFQVMKFSFLYIIQTIYMSRIANNQLKANFIWAPGSVPSQFGSTSLFVTKNSDWLLNWTLDIKLLVTHHIKISSFCISMSIYLSGYTSAIPFAHCCIFAAITVQAGLKDVVFIISAFFFWLRFSQC